ncbi:MAG: Rv3235 family protein [Mycobacterium sp.]
MTASHISFQPGSFTAPVVDYEPPPLGAAARVSAALHRSPRRPLRSVHRVAREPSPPHAAAVFADAALRRVLEVIDRRRPISQLKALMTPALMDMVVAMARSPHAAAATLRRVRLRMVDTADTADTEVQAAEVFGTYSRAQRARAIAARIELCDDRWRIVALHIG